MATAQSHGADILVPFTPSTCPLEQADGRALDGVAWLHHDGQASHSRSAAWRYDGQRGRVRLVAKRVGAHARQVAERRVRRTAQNHGCALSAVALFRCGGRLLLTTLGAENGSTAELRWLYRARWHVAVLFNRMKQLLRLQVGGR